MRNFSLTNRKLDLYYRNTKLCHTFTLNFIFSTEISCIDTVHANTKLLALFIQYTKPEIQEFWHNDRNRKREEKTPKILANSYFHIDRSWGDSRSSSKKCSLPKPREAWSPTVSATNSFWAIRNIIPVRCYSSTALGRSSGSFVQHSTINPLSICEYAFLMSFSSSR